MTRIALVAFAIVILLQPHGAARLLVPNLPDLTLTVTTTWNVNNPHANSLVVVHQFKGAWHRQEAVSGLMGPTLVTVDRCDERRILHLNTQARLYGYSGVSDVQTYLVVGPSSSTGHTTGPSAAQPITATTTDLRDTGERRRMGPHTARHIITAAQTRVIADGREHVSLEERDGWYLDLPEGCVDLAEQDEKRLTLSIEPQLHMVRTGSGRRGFVVEESTRRAPAGGGPINQYPIESTTVLTSISEQTIDSARFAVPPDYQPALQRPGFGVDMMRADTMMNRAAAYWESAVWWVSAVVRNWSN